MGGSVSTSSNQGGPTATIRFFEPAYFPGSNVTGEIYLSVAHQSANRLEIRFRGTEITSGTYIVRRQVKSGNSYRTVVSRYPKRTTSEIINVGQYLPDVYSPGMQVRIPFSFNLPNYLPPTYFDNTVRSSDWENGKAEIEYGIDLLANGRFITRQVFNVLPRLPQSVPQAKQEIFPVNKFMCIAAGDLVISMQLGKSILLPNETVGLYFNVENKSEIELSDVVVSLVHVTHVKIDQYNLSDTDVYATYKFPRLEAGQSILNQAVSLQPMGMHSNRATLFSKLITSEYFVRVEAVRCCAPDKKLETALVVGPSPPNYQQYYQQFQPFVQQAVMYQAVQPVYLAPVMQQQVQTVQAPQYYQQFYQPPAMQQQQQPGMQDWNMQQQQQMGMQQQQQQMQPQQPMLSEAPPQQYNPYSYGGAKPEWMQSNIPPPPDSPLPVENAPRPADAD